MVTVSYYTVFGWERDVPCVCVGISLNPDPRSGNPKPRKEQLLSFLFQRLKFYIHENVEELKNCRQLLGQFSIPTNITPEPK